MPSQIHLEDLSQPQSNAHLASLSSPPPTPSQLHPSSVTLESARGMDRAVKMPSYIRPDSREFDPEDIHYLRRRGALSIPDPILRDQLLLAFILYVHPALPVVDLQDVIDAIEGRPGCDVSLILFQAIMFSGTAFVDLQLLLDAGFESRLSARAYFYRKVKVSCCFPRI